MTFFCRREGASNLLTSRKGKKLDGLNSTHSYWLHHYAHCLLRNFLPNFQTKNLPFFEIPKIFVNKNAIKRENSGVRGHFLSKIGVVTIWSQFEFEFGTFFS